MTLEDFRQIVKDLENNYEEERKRRNEKPDNSWKQIEAIAKLDSRSLYKLDNGMFVTSEWCREYQVAIDAWALLGAKRLAE